MRYLPLTDTDRRAMLGVIGAKSVDDLFRDVPREAYLTTLVDLPMHAGELEVERQLVEARRAQHRRPAACRSSAAPAPTATMSPHRSIT